MEALNSMVKYKTNLIFKEKSKSLTEIITEVLRIELQKRFMTCNYKDYSQGERNN